MTDAADQRDMAALAKGGRTNFLGFLLRLGATFPFMLIAGRMYGAAALGRYALATLAVDLAGQLCTLGQKRGLAQRLAGDERRAANIIADGMMLSLMMAALVAGLLWWLPAIMFPSGAFALADRLLVLAIFPITFADIALAALAYRYDVGATVRARSIIQPWALSLTALGVWFVDRPSGLSIAYLVSMTVCGIAALVPLLRSFGLPRGWRPHPLRIGRLALTTMPLAVADIVEWGTRKLDIYILGIYSTLTPESVGVYYVAQQVATLPQKLKTSFEPILGPVITRNLRARNFPGIARQVCQVGFWITAAQAGIALALGIPGRGVLGLMGPQFVEGDLALQFLLAAEVGAAAAVVSEAALIYMAPMRNLWLSLGTIVLQAVLTIIGMHVDDGFHLTPFDRASSAAGALLVTLCLASLAKTLLLRRLLGQPVSNLRWSLLLAVVPAAMVGWAANAWLPEWAEIAFGIPAILATYCGVIWTWGFGPDDRVLLRRDAGAPQSFAGPGEPAAPAIVESQA
ncbi:MAG: oligosaccharide flippase family protein [Proteobacteria bacterium]|nr:oligosaccharide flippase family protein [Pseudomonadota bacterium]